MSEDSWTFDRLIDTLLAQASKPGPKACETCILLGSCMDLKADFTCDGFVELLRVLGVERDSKEKELSEVKRTTGGMLDLSTCPTCGKPTCLNAKTSGETPTRLWWCDHCKGWWQQTKGRDATWIPQFAEEENKSHE